MPPWFADPKCGHFSNERSLTESEIYTLWSWTAEGAPKGDLKDMPAPDVVLQLPKPFPVPESGMVGCQYVIVPPGFTERHLGASGRGPAHRACRGSPHHCFVREPGSNYFKDQKPEVFFEAPPAKTDEKTDTSALPSDFLVGYAPGQPAEMLQPGQGKLIKPGSDIVFEVHYTPNGKAVMDQTKLGLVLARETPKDRVQTLSASNGTFKIPPGDPDYRVDASFEVARQVVLSALHPHMHTRGKDFEYRLVFPNGETRTILQVPAYNGHWQLWYNLQEPNRSTQGDKDRVLRHILTTPQKIRRIRIPQKR